MTSKIAIGLFPLFRKVGFMRGGQLLAEDCPSALLKMFGATTLEEVALHLCRLHEARPSISEATKEAFVRGKSFSTGDKKEVSEDEESGVVKAKTYRRLSITLQDNVVLSPVNVETDHTSVVYALVLKAWRRRKRDWRYV